MQISEKMSIFTFSSEKVCAKCDPPPFLANVHVLRPSEPEKMVFAKVSVCLSVCIHDNFWKNWPIELKLGTLVKCQEMKVNFVSQPFLTNGSGFIHKNGFYKIKKSIFRPNNARYEKMLETKIVYLKKIYNFYFDHFLIKRRVFVLIVKNVIKNQKFNFPDKICDIRNKC